MIFTRSTRKFKSDRYYKKYSKKYYINVLYIPTYFDKTRVYRNMRPDALLSLFFLFPYRACFISKMVQRSPRAQNDDVLYTTIRQDYLITSKRHMGDTDHWSFDDRLKTLTDNPTSFGVIVLKNENTGKKCMYNTNKKT